MLLQAPYNSWLAQPLIKGIFPILPLTLHPFDVLARIPEVLKRKVQSAGYGRAMQDLSRPPRPALGSTGGSPWKTFE
jgi:hypothetical protein